MEKLKLGEYSRPFHKPAETEEERKKWLELAEIKLAELRKLAAELKKKQVEDDKK